MVSIRTRLTALALVVLGVVLSAVCTLNCSKTRNAKPAEPEATLVLNWIVEPSHGGYLAALQDGLFHSEGVKVTVTSGGPNVAGYSLLGAGKVDFAQLNESGLLSAREQGIPLVAVFADLQDSPQVLMFHKDNPVADFAALAGRKVAVPPGEPYWDFLQAKFQLDGKVRQVNANGQQAMFLTDRTLVQQGYAVSEPFTIKKKSGEEVGMLRISECGFNPYSLLATTEDMIQKHPDTVRAVVRAAREGWKRYLADPAKYAPALKARNPDLADDFLTWGSAELAPYVRGKGVETTEHGLGWMTDERWTSMYDALKSVGVLKKTQDPRQAFTVKFLAP